MRYLVILTALISTAAFADPGKGRYPDYTGPVKYPAGTSTSAVAQNEAVRVSIRGTKGLEYCAFIDTRDPRGKCLHDSVLDGGGSSGSSPGDSAGGAAGAAGGTK